MKKLSLYVFLVLMFFLTTSANSKQQCKGTNSSKWTNCIGFEKIKSPSDILILKGYYVGEYQNGKYDGWGVVDYDDYHTYIGQFKNGNYQGKGIMVDPIAKDGKIYRGIWQDGELIEDHGISLLPQCEVGDEQWTNCQGYQEDPESGDEYIGEFINDKAFGEGTRTINSGKYSGHKYVGEFKEGEVEGLGIYFSTGKIFHVGQFKNHKINGLGKMSSPGKYKYIGQLEDNQKNGLGIYIWENLDGFVGVTYFGEWKDDDHHGQGTIIFPDGEKYVGQWINGWAEGKGVVSHPDGGRYVGELKEGRWHGQGTYISASGEIKKGIWENGKLVKPN